MNLTRIFALALGGGYTLTWLLYIIDSTDENFRMLLDFNAIGEGYFEVILFSGSFLFILYSLAREIFGEDKLGRKISNT